ncbi:acetyl/propionyl/methylcrotonyl-CoA carboxylase subunit alpha [Streptomyces apocyni]|uniref:acetyl/propionyl/methylcrotonyl-CoA carboxylase subunit alpha n=1 Tax=Streptomyces apocyni TaxID=2654677 RepID=UPI0012EA09C3|nr:biotin carboxylase N-terminal domain-containing protein [Streptomyces apocyni]
MIRTLLVANRGEIACRIFRTCRELGIATVAVYSDADAGALHVREADTAVRLPGAAPADTYLRGDLIVKAAQAAVADAIHPGYGFLSENADFARAVADAGLVWIGPPPEAIDAMASKTRAKELMGVAPLAADAVTEADLPVLVKAASGGGGRGMRVVRELGQLEAELKAAGAEAASAFGDGAVFVEPYVEGGRHVEVQVMADAYGTVWALGTRDCSPQRRHQKVIEEAPAPGLSDATRDTLRELSLRAARATGYLGAGTVEFLVADERVQFLEMNTRLQVEHPVTEAVFGLDLVALQLRIAEGDALPPSPPEPHGHAVEARLYAEDPGRDWAPQTGRLHQLAVPSSVRLDTGYADGDEIGVHYDPMLAKVVAWAPTRAEAVRKLAGALERARVHGPVTNRELLVRSLRHAEFVAGEVDTGFYERHLPELTAAPSGEAEALSAVAAALADVAVRTAGVPPTPPLPETGGKPPDPQIALRARPQTPDGLKISARPAFEDRGLGRSPSYGKGREWGRGTAQRPTRIGAWRNVPSQPQVKRYLGRAEHQVRYWWTRDGGAVLEGHPGVRVLHITPHHVHLEVDGVRRQFEVAAYDDGRVYVDTPNHPSHTLTALPRFPDPTPAHQDPGSLLAPMPGTVVRVADALAEGDRVQAGQPLLWLEAMKMEHRVTAPVSGTLTALHAAPGRQVEVGALLAVVVAHEEEPQP